MTARKTKAEGRADYTILVAEMRSISNPTALEMWRKNNRDRVNILPVDWIIAMIEEWDISMKALLEHETGGVVEMREINQTVEV